jgi:hypothetical protein
MENNYFLFDDEYGLYNYPGSAFLEGASSMFSIAPTACLSRSSTTWSIGPLIWEPMEAGEKTYVLAPSPKGPGIASMIAIPLWSAAIFCSAGNAPIISCLFRLRHPQLQA